MLDGIAAIITACGFLVSAVAGLLAVILGQRRSKGERKRAARAAIRKAPGIRDLLDAIAEMGDDD